MLLVDYIRKASLIGALLPYSFDKFTLTSILGMTSFGSDLVLRYNQDSHCFSGLQAKKCSMTYSTEFSTEQKCLLQQIQRHFCQLEEAFSALNPSFTGEAGTRNCSFQDRAVLRKCHQSRSFNVIQVRMISEVTVPGLSSLSDGQWLLGLQERHVQLQRCP